jgi:hypothetical protein
MEVAVFWDVTPCSLAERGQRMRGAYCLQRQDDFLRNIAQFIPDNAV